MYEQKYVESWKLNHEKDHVKIQKSNIRGNEWKELTLLPDSSRLHPHNKVDKPASPRARCKMQSEENVC